MMKINDWFVLFFGLISIVLLLIGISGILFWLFWPETLWWNNNIINGFIFGFIMILIILATESPKERFYKDYLEKKRKVKG